MFALLLQGHLIFHFVDFALLLAFIHVPSGIYN